MKQTGQAFPPFNLLIGAIMGLAILVIVLGIVTYFENQKFELSKKRFDRAIDTAIQSPTGDVLEEKDVLFRGGESFSAHGFASSRGMDASCFELQGRNADIVEVVSDQLVNIRRNAPITVYYKCETKADYAGCACNVCCVISFGQKPV